MQKHNSFEVRLFIFIIITLLTFTSTAFARTPGFLFTRTRPQCTPQYWSSSSSSIRGEEWPRMVPKTATVSKVFGSRAFERYGPNLTLFQSTTLTKDNNAYGELVKQGSAALLNSYARKPSFPYSPWEVKTAFFQALVSPYAAAAQVTHFALANDSCA